MTRTDEALAQGRTPRTDEELLAAVRAQRPHAFQDLRDRHWHTAVVVARLHTPSRQDAEQLAGTAFDQVLAEIGDGDGDEDGPGVFLRARLVAVVGRAGVEQEVAAEGVTGIYLGLPASWQAVLWHLEIEALGVERTATVLGLSQAATTALHLEARARLRAAYRQARQEFPTLIGCGACAGDLGAFADGGLSAERRQAVQFHLDECPRCTADHLYLQDTEAGLRGWLLPVLAGVPLWDARTDELVELVRAAGRMSAGRLSAAPGTDVAGGALAAVHVSRRGRKVLLGAGALAAAAALAGVAVTGSGGLGDGTTQATGRIGGAGATASSASAPSASSRGVDAATVVRGPGATVPGATVPGATGPGATGPGATVPGGAGGVLSLPTSEPSPGPLTEAAAEARTARAGGGAIGVAATPDGTAAGSREDGGDSGASTGTRIETAPRTPGSVQEEVRAPRPAVSRVESPGAQSSGAQPSGGQSSGRGTTGGSPAAGGGGSTPASPSADDRVPPTGGTPAEQPPAAETAAPESPIAGTPVEELPAPGAPATQVPADVTPVDEAPAGVTTVDDAAAGVTTVDDAAAGVTTVDDARAGEAPASGAPAGEIPASATPASEPSPGASGDAGGTGPSDPTGSNPGG